MSGHVRPPQWPFEAAARPAGLRLPDVGLEFGDSPEVVGCGRIPHEPAHSLQSAQLHLSQSADRLQPAEDLFDEGPSSLTDRLPHVPSGAAVQGASASVGKDARTRFGVTCELGLSTSS